jgi:hypothetical protein
LLGEFLANVFALRLGGLITKGGWRRRWDRNAAKGIVLGGVRVVSGSQSGLGREWTIGDWRVRPGQLTLEAIEIEILGIVAGSRRVAKLSETLGGGENTVIFTVRTATSDLDWSIVKRSEVPARLALNVPIVDARTV